MKRNIIIRIKNKIEEIMYDLYKKILFKIVISKKKINTEKRDERIIVSMATIPSRFNKVHYAIETLLRQSMMPDKIILYIDDDYIDLKLPEKLLKQKERGLEICYVKSLKSHNKYFYSFTKYKKDIIITVDDDLYYPHNLIETLYKSYKNNKNCVSTMRLHKITFDNEEIENYKNWLYEYQEKDALIPSNIYLATGGGGTLYPPNILKKEWDNVENIKKLALGQDDIWLKYMEIINGIKVVRATDKRYKLRKIVGTQKISLKINNVLYGKNDEAIRTLSKYYKITKNDFMKE